MKFSKRTVGGLMLTCAVLSILSLSGLPRVYAPSTGNQYSLVAVPSTAPEGTTVSLVLSVSIMGISTGPTQYSFIFIVRDPVGATFQSQMINHTSPLGETHFSVVANYTSSEFPGVNSLAGTYSATVDQIAPSPIATVAGPTTFVLSSIDNLSYQRTETVKVQASGYNSSETVNVTIKTRTIPTIVFSQSATASGTGVVTTSWKIPVNATIDNYIAFLNGTTTHKNPPDNQTFAVRAAILTVSGISSARTTYQRTDTMKFSFQPVYPDGTTIASTGLGLLTLTGPNGKKVTLTATYDSIAQTFNATYATSATNQTGAWTLSLAARGYSDAINPSNSGPANPVSTTVQLSLATLSVTVSTNTSPSVGQQLRLNVTLAYPDGSNPSSATVRAYLVYSGTPAINDTVPLVYDSGLGFWVGTRTISASDTGGLWSLIVTASDTATPANTGTATRAITIQNTSSPTSSASFPLYFFGIIAAIIAGLLLAVLLLFRRRRVGHTSLKIDLDAVHSEAGRIENQEFFKTIKEQVRKDLDDKP